MVFFAVEDVKELFQTTLLPSLQAGGSQVELAAIDECFQAPNPFSKLQSEHLQTNDYRENLVRVGSMRFEVLEPPRTRAEAPCTPCFPFNAVARKVSVRSNHPEHMCQNSPHLAISVMKWFDVLEPP